MSALLDSLAKSFDGDTERRAVLDAALHDGLPGPRSEAWKYTSLRALERRVFAPAMPILADIDPALLADIPAPRLVFVNGRFDACHSDAAGLPDGVALLPLSQVMGSGDPRASNFLARRYRRSDEVFARLNAEGRTVVLITHEPEVAAGAKRVVRLRDGLITQDVRQ